MSTNLSHPCSNHPTSIRSPHTWGPHDAYTAIGPIFNFTEAVTSCCPDNGTVSHYPGGPEALSCYYLCAFNGTIEDMREAMACNSGAAGKRRRASAAGNSSLGGWASMGHHPDIDSGAAAAGFGGSGGKLGLWRSVVLALVVVGVTAVGLV